MSDLVAGVRALLDYDPATGMLTWRRRPGAYKGWNERYVGTTAGTRDTHGYLRVSIHGRQYAAHRLVWAHVHGEWPSGQIDHKNGVRDDNRIANLRVATGSQNQQNIPPRRGSASGIKGVSRNGGRWQAHIRTPGRRIYLGMFKTPEEAGRAYREAAARLHGEFARIA
jgi:hypothetical protein